MAFTLPAEILVAMGDGQAKSNPILLTLPNLSTSTSSASARVTALSGSVDMSTLQVSLVGSYFQVSVSGTAQATLSLTAKGLSFTPTVKMPTIDVSAKVGWDDFDSVFVVEPNGVQVSLPGISVSGCGALGWCDPIANMVVSNPIVEAVAESAIAQGLTSAFTSGVGFPVPSQILRAIAMTHAMQSAPPPPPQGATDWWITELNLANGLVNCQIERFDEPTPVVTAVAPRTGAAGDTVSLSTQFVQQNGNPVSVTFGGVPSPYVNCSGSVDGCYAQVPPGSGTVDVVVTGTNGVATAISSSDQFTYAPVQITSMGSIMGAPTLAGAVTGGSVLQVWGSGFSPTATKFYFGGVLAASYCDADTTCVVTSPAVTTPGPVHVTAVVNGATSKMTASDIFTYTEYPNVIGMAPSLNPQGTINGGTIHFDSIAGGTSVALSSSNPSFLDPPATVTVPAGETGVSFKMAQLASAAGSATISATSYGLTTAAVFDGACYGTCPMYMAWNSSTCSCVRNQPVGGGGGGGGCITCKE